MSTRSELREKIMTILYQIDLYKRNNIEFDVDSTIKENVEIDNEFVMVSTTRPETIFGDCAVAINSNDLRHMVHLCSYVKFRNTFIRLFIIL